MPFFEITNASVISSQRRVNHPQVQTRLQGLEGGRVFADAPDLGSRAECFHERDDAVRGASDEELLRAYQLEGR